MRKSWLCTFVMSFAMLCAAPIWSGCDSFCDDSDFEDIFDDDDDFEDFFDDDDDDLFGFLCEEDDDFFDDLEDLFDD